MIEAKAFRTFIRLYTLFKSERLSANIKLTLHKALNRSLMTYACPAWELAADTYLLKLQLYKTGFSAQLEIFRGVPRSAICAQLSIIRMCTII
jgi:hypothetical protein